jgi:taurine dioxygenase
VNTVSFARPAAESPAQRFEIRRLGMTFGAEVVGLDLGTPLSDEDFARVHRAHLEHHVLVFRDQRITPAHLRRLLYRTTIEGDVPC